MNTEGLMIVAEATKVLAPEVYKDTLHAGMKEIGGNVHTLSKLVTIALTPISAIVWGYEKIKAYIVPALEERLQNIPKEKIIQPDTMIAGPTLEALRFAGHKEELRELYANLLAASMNSDTANKAHPAFVEIIKQLSPDEAKLLSCMKTKTSYPLVSIRSKDKTGVAFGVPLSNFCLIPYDANCKYPELGPSYLGNLSRLGILDLSYATYVINPPNSYDAINIHPYITQLCELIKDTDKIPELRQGSITFTELGRQFYEACIE